MGRNTANYVSWFMIGIFKMSRVFKCEGDIQDDPNEMGRITQASWSGNQQGVPAHAHNWKR